MKLQRTLVTVQPDLEVLPAFGDVADAADTDFSLRSRNELERDQRGVVRRREGPATCRAFALDEACHVAAESCDVAQVPAGEINHVRAQAAEDSVPLVGVGLPLVGWIECAAVL